MIRDVEREGLFVAEVLSMVEQYSRDSSIPFADGLTFASIHGDDDLSPQGREDKKLAENLVENPGFKKLVCSALTSVSRTLDEIIKVVCEKIFNSPDNSRWAGSSILITFLGSHFHVSTGVMFFTGLIIANMSIETFCGSTKT